MIAQRGIVEVKQETDNDCFPACVASITGLPKKDMPHLKHCYLDKIVKRRSRWHRWQRRNGYVFRLMYREIISIPVDEYYISFHMLVGSDQWAHAVVSYNGKQVFNPSQYVVGSPKEKYPFAVLTLNRVEVG